MNRHPHSEQGFHLVAVALVVLVVGVIGLVGYTVFNRDNQRAVNVSSTAKNAEPVKWAFNEQQNKWFPQSGSAPKCNDPFIFERTPVDLSKIMVIGMPGAYRGYNYKPHGGLRLSNPSSGAIDIVMPTDATLVSLTRYYEGSPSELQYLLTFETDCGIAFRFDHLYKLSPAFQAIAETTPAPKKDDTRTDPNIPFTRTKFKAGDLIATEVGFPRIKNFGFDFGTYDYRKRNKISANKQWVAQHNTYTSLEWFGTCWIDQLPGSDAAKAKQLSLVVINPAKPNIISDYCVHAPHTTLDFNGGRPTDG